jgi:DNA repair exonuclease SbcCD ATPase subunit
MEELQESISFYSTIDVDEEKDKFDFLEELKTHKQKLTETISELRSDMKDVQSSIDKEDREIEILSEKYEKEEKKNESLKGNICPTCKQDWEDQDAIESSDAKLLDYGKQILAFEKSLEEHEKAKKQIKKAISDKKGLLEEIREAMDEVETQVDRKELDNIDVVVTNLKHELDNLKNQENHFLAEIEANKGLLREVDMTEIDTISEEIGIYKNFIKQNDDQKLRGKFLRKFIRQSNDILKSFKKLIPDFNIHLQFNPDFTIRLMKLGKEVSAGTLSNGEKRIGNIMIMLALMKVFKLKNHVEFNALFMDEVLDSGINGTLLESVYYFIKNVAKQEKMRVYMISHREEIKEKIKETILVTKSRGISTLQVNPDLKKPENS